MRIVHGQDVFEELVEISLHIALGNEPAAQRFLTACDDTFKALANSPKIGSVRNFSNPLLDEVRMWRVKGFGKYLIFYQPIPKGNRILHVVHGARNYDLLFEDE